MKLAICTDVFADLSYTYMLDKVKSLGIDAVEMTAGGWGARKHCNTAELLADAGKREAFMMELEKRGIEHIAIEEFPGTMVWSASTLLKLREATDPMLGINLDPSHMMVLGADPIAAARALKGCIFHVHGKDARIERGLADTDGLLEPRPVTESADRVWNYVAVGCGKDLQWWKKFFSVCHMMGYDGDVSLKMEDLTMTVDAGVHTSIDALRQTISR